MMSQPLRNFQLKLKWYYGFNTSYFIWAVLALIFYIIITTKINSACSQLKTYIIIWTCSYGVELIVPIVGIVIGNQSKYFSFGYTMCFLSIVYKIVVIVSLGLGAWGVVGSCQIPIFYSLIIIITNALQILCLIVQWILIWRIKVVNREILVEKLIQTKTFAET